MLKRTAEVVKTIIDELNESELGQQTALMMEQCAKEKGFSRADLEKAKVELVVAIYYNLALKHDDVRNMLAKDLWEKHHQKV